MGRDLESQRASKKRYYDKNRQMYYERNERNRLARRAVIDQHKAKPCADCGEQYPPYVMDFDHLESVDKVGNIATYWQRWGMAKLLAEIAKCEVVCSNCHRERTHRRRTEGRSLHA